VFKGEMKAMKEEDKTAGDTLPADAATSSAADATTSAAPSNADGTTDHKP
jgi:sec-independent protein translocase protein TatA